MDVKVLLVLPEFETSLIKYLCRTEYISWIMVDITAKRHYFQTLSWKSSHAAMRKWNIEINSYDTEMAQQIYWSLIKLIDTEANVSDLMQIRINVKVISRSVIGWNFTNSTANIG